MAQAELVMQAAFFLSVLGTLALLVTLEFNFQPHVLFQRWSTCVGYVPARSRCGKGRDFFDVRFPCFPAGLGVLDRLSFNV
jgi:hypothetical protein